MPTDNTLSWSWSRNYAESDLISVCQEFVLNGRKVAYGKQDNTQNIKKNPQWNPYVSVASTQSMSLITDCFEKEKMIHEVYYKDFSEYPKL